MTGKELAELMQNAWLKSKLAKHARRRSRDVETQEEYIQDGWIRIAEQNGGKTLEWYSDQARKAMHAAYMQKWRVHKKTGQNVNGIGREVIRRPPMDSLHLYGNKYLIRNPEKLSPWYYDGEWEDCAWEPDGPDDYLEFEHYKIVIVDAR